MLRSKGYKFIVVLVICLLFSGVVVLPRAHARPWHGPGHHHHHHYHHHGWSSGAGWAIAGLVGGAIIAHNAQYRRPVHIFMDYEGYRAYFVAHMDSAEAELWADLDSLPSGRDYTITYKQGSTARRIKKFAKHLYKDIQFLSQSEQRHQVTFHKLTGPDTRIEGRGLRVEGIRGDEERGIRNKR